MSDWITVTGLKPYDGRYELDLDGQPLTTREWGWIKRHAGYLPLTLGSDGFADPELVSVLAAIAVRRNGTITADEVAGFVERLADTPFGSTIVLETDPVDTEDDAGPPPESSASRPNGNGASSTSDSESSAVTPTATGLRPSATSPSAPQMSVS